MKCSKCIVIKEYCHIVVIPFFYPYVQIKPKTPFIYYKKRGKSYSHYIHSHTHHHNRCGVTRSASVRHWGGDGFHTRSKERHS